MKAENEKVLVLTSSGGGGLLQAAVAKEQEVRRDNPKANILKVDMLKSWAPKLIGMLSIYLWNTAQKKGQVKKLEWCLSQLRYCDFVIWPVVFFRTFRFLMKHQITRFIDTQPLGTAPMLKALRLYNHFRKRKVLLERVIVDLPTKKAVVFFKPVKALSKKDLEVFKLITIEPLLEKEETKDDFWMKYAGLKDREISYEPYFIRESFKNCSKKKIDHEIHLSVQLTKDAKELTKRALKKGVMKYDETKEGFNFNIDKEDLIFTVLLGSQPAFSATLGYVQKAIDFARKHLDKQGALHVFVLCAEHEKDKPSLLQEVSNLVAGEKDFPSNLTVVPLTFQKDSVIAPLFQRSDMTCTRSGGHTSMELMEVVSGTICVHSETKGENLTTEELLRGIPGWEAGNAEYLMAKVGAHLVTPCLIDPYLDELFEGLVVNQVAN